MNEIEQTFQLRQFTMSPEGWGRAFGVPIQRKLASYIDDSKVQVARIALDSVQKIDVTFASVVLVELVRQNLGQRAICLCNLANDDIFENIAAAAGRMKVPVTIWHGGTVQVVGLVPSPALRAPLLYALERSEVRAAWFAAASGQRIANASTKFKQLWEQGFLIRHESHAASGGAEYVYRRIG